MNSRSTSESEEGEIEESEDTPDPGRGGPLHPPLETRVIFGDMAYGGDAVGRDPSSGMALFAWPGIKGEEASVEITSRGKHLLRGVVRDVHTVSPVRTTPPCPYFGSCGGCQWQHISYDGQVAFKKEILR